MGDKKKRTTEIRSNHSCDYVEADESMQSEMTMVEQNHQFGHPADVKVEASIKDEPQSDGENVDVSISVRINSGVVPGFGVHQSDGEYNFDKRKFDRVKVEVKQEVDDKKEEEKKAGADSGGDAMESQRDARRQPPAYDQVEAVPSTSSHGAKNTKSSGIVGKPKNVLKKHRCDFCEFSNNYKCLLKRHLLKHTGEKPHGCELCPKSFTSKQTLQAHVKVHVKDFLFHCSGCLHGFNEKNEKIKHETECRARRYECHLCKESFGSKKSCMMNHMRVHSGSKPFECKECFKQFTQKGSLNEHIKLHGGPRSFRCSNCQKGFAHQVERNAHEDKCNRDMLKCDVCGKSFGLFKSKLISHMVTHTGETSFKCLRCSKQFKHKFSLNRHMASHSRNLPFECLVCCKGFSKDGKRKAHQRNCNARGYECYLCKKFFRSNEELKDHMHTHSGVKPFQCEIYRNTFIRNRNVIVHMKNIHNKEN